jgi:hypothetical protein
VPRKLNDADEAIEDFKPIRRWLTQPGPGEGMLPFAGD